MQAPRHIFIEDAGAVKYSLETTQASYSQRTRASAK